MMKLKRLIAGTVYVLSIIVITGAFIVANLNQVKNLLLADTAEAAGITPLGQDNKWDLIFSDEFEGTDLDLNKWEPSWFGGNNISNPVNTDEDGCYDPKQVSVSNGMLNLTAVSTDNNNCRKRDGSRAGYASGLVNTRKSFTFAYGYMEARIFLPGGDGEIWNWPAFWSAGTGDWPKTGEIDVMEGLSSHKACWHYHYEDSSGDHQAFGDCADDFDGTGWHTYAAEWEDGKVTYYYDGVEVGTIEEGIVDDEHFLILNNGINDRYGINVPSTVLVDYVRVWKKSKSDSNTSEPIGPAETTPPVSNPDPISNPEPTSTVQSSGVVVESFSISPSSRIKDSTRVRAIAKVTSKEPVKLQALTVAVRDSRNRNYDFRGAVTNITVGPEGYEIRTDKRKFRRGKYTAFVAYKMDNKWYNMEPEITFTVR